ncbi:putative pheromone A receptor [Lyophyllum shimeji]|uniref:Pheromone A receptor n=1 Tax=Lyophyllum shimeji TaxID=47721 RepID=A0A9P3PZ65_LYOSH|nr:putative pheromone A receptor [Lyophyllum shimeji]
MHLELPIAAFTAALLVLVPLPWHWRAKNVPTLSIVAWLFVSNVIYGVNAVVWAGNVRIVATVWCDIVTKVQIGATMALPASCLCLCIHLERIASIRNVQSSPAQKRRRFLFDLAMCWLIPVIYMALHYVVQGHRFDIVEDFGCRPAIYNSVQSVLLVWVPPLLVATLTCIYAGVSLRHFFVRRVTFARHLQNSNSALTTSRYFRLICMAIVQMFWGLLATIVNVWFSCRTGLRQWTGWADVHFNFSRIALFPTLFIPPDVLRWTFFTWWVIPISSVLFFVFFSFGEDAMKEYTACIQWVARTVFRRKGTADMKLSLPSFVRKPVPRKAVPNVDIKVTTDTQSTRFTDTAFTPHKEYPPSFDMSSSFIATPSTTASFSTYDSSSTYIVPFPTHETHPLPAYR